MSATLSFWDMACRIFYFSQLHFSKLSRKSSLVITREFFRLSERFLFYAELNRKFSSWPKSEDDFLPSFDFELTDREVCFPFPFWMLVD